MELQGITSYLGCPEMEPRLDLISATVEARLNVEDFALKITGQGLRVPGACQFSFNFLWVFLPSTLLNTFFLSSKETILERAVLPFCYQCLQLQQVRHECSLFSFFPVFVSCPPRDFK